MQRPLPVESRSLGSFQVEIYGFFVYIKIELCGSHRIAVFDQTTELQTIRHLTKNVKFFQQE